MKILAIESSAGPVSCAILEEGRVLASAAVHTGLTHSQTLMPMVDAMLHNAAVSLKEIDMLAVAAGPGSFTGIRIGVAAVKGLAFTQEKPCVGVSTLAAMARTMQDEPFSGVICAAMDARCHQVYTALFLCENGIVSRMTPDEAVTLDELEKKLISLKKMVIFVGDGAELCYNTFADSDLNMRLAPTSQRFQNAVGVALEASESVDRAVSASALQPAYLRLPQAERELKKHTSL